MAKNKLSDLNDHLFEMIERLKDDDCKDTDITKAEAVNNVARTLIESAKMELKAMEMLGMSKGFTGLVQPETKQLPPGA